MGARLDSNRTHKGHIRECGLSQTRGEDMDSDPTAGPDLGLDEGGGTALAFAPAENGSAAEARSAEIAPLEGRPTEAEDGEAAGHAVAAPPSTLLGTRLVSGRYRSSGSPFRVELRVDVD